MLARLNNECAFCMYMFYVQQNTIVKLQPQKAKVNTPLFHLLKWLLKFFICKIRIKIKCAHYWIAFLVLFHKSDTVYSLKMVLSLCTVYIQTLFVRYHKTPAVHIIIAFFFIHKCLVHHTKLLVFIPTYLA